MKASRSLAMAAALALPLLAGRGASAQDIDTTNSKPASSNAAGMAFPRLDAQNRATFRLMAKDANKVQVRVGGGTYDMTKDTAGAWTVTTPPLVEGFHYYTVVVDGANVSDPGSESFYGTSRQSSAIEVPATDQEFYMPKDVAHGDIREHWYFSKTTGKWRLAYIYTPPGYDRDTKKHYPVLYIQHGFGEDQRGWATQGRMNFIMDNLIAAGKAVPMILVSDDGGIQVMARRPRPPIATNAAPPAPGAPAAGAAPARPPMDFSAMLAPFTKVMIDDIIPMVDATYRTIPDREHRAMAGLSMGGGQTFYTAFNNLDKFAYIAGFSPLLPAPEFQKIMADPKGFNAKVKVLFLNTGGAERERNPNILRMHESLDSVGIKNVYYESPGTAHEWLTWRRALYQFAPLIFR